MNEVSDEIINELIEIDDPHNESTCLSIIKILSINIILILIISSKCFKHNLKITKSNIH